MSTAAAFKSIIHGTGLTAADEGAYETHRVQVQRCLQASFDVAQVLTIGSYARGSAIRQSSDLDLLVLLRRSEVRWGRSPKSSRTTLGAVRDALLSRFPWTSMRRDKQAVVVDFSDKRRIDVVPSWWAAPRDDGWPTYGIPDGEGGWMATSPKRHAKYITDADARSGGKLKHVARILKYWRISRTVPIPISSFYVELLMASAGLCSVGAAYGECFASLLASLHEIGCEPIKDPLGVSEGVEACTTEAKLGSAVHAVAAAADRALRAVEAEERGRMREALRLWDLVFNRTFPRV